MFTAGSKHRQESAGHNIPAAMLFKMEFNWGPLHCSIYHNPVFLLQIYTGKQYGKDKIVFIKFSTEYLIGQQIVGFKITC